MARIEARQPLVIWLATERKRMSACDVSEGSPVQRVSLATDGQLRLFRTWLIAES